MPTVREIADKLYDLARELPPGETRIALYGLALDLYRIDVDSQPRV